VLRGHTDTVHALAVTPDGRTLISGSGDQSLGFWELPSGVLAGILVPDRLGRPVTRWERWQLDTGPEVLALAISPDGHTLAVAIRDNTIRLVDVPSRRESSVLGAADSTVYAMAFTPDGRFLVSGSDDRRVTLWDLQTIRARGGTSGRRAGPPQSSP
jgi:WD40 repeat protein